MMRQVRISVLGLVVASALRPPAVPTAVTTRRAGVPPAGIVPEEQQPAAALATTTPTTSRSEEAMIPRAAARRRRATTGSSWSRRSLAALGVVACASTAATPAPALVKGAAPPPKSSASAAAGGRPKCRSVDECEEVGSLREQAAFDANAPFEVTADGVRYRDVVASADAARPVAKNDVVTIKYRVMRLGKRSQDNLSGEASPVFSLGYGEDDDAETDVLTAKVGNGELIAALDSALVGMKVGAKRRLFVVPEKGWKKINASCTAESNGALNTGLASAGGIDALGQAVVPLAQVVDNDACIEEVKQPQPRNFGARRRLARRFDEGLLVEVELVGNVGNKY